MNVEVLILGSVQAFKVIPIIEVEREPSDHLAPDIDFSRRPSVTGAMELSTILLGIDVVQVVKPTGNMLASPVWSRTIKAVIIFAVSLV